MKMIVKDFLINQDCNIRDAIKKINKNSRRTLFVVNKKKKLIGSITDGDLRSLFLKGNISNQILVKKVMNKNPIFLYFGEYNKNKEKKLLQNEIQIVPIINKKQEIINIIERENIRKIFLAKIPLLIVAGGLGKRMRPLTERIPKPMVKISGKPIIEYIIRDAKNQGIENIIISTGYLGKKIKNFFGNGKKLKININYLEENKPLGTAGFINKLKNEKIETLLVTNGDVMSKIDYFSLINFHLNKKSNATMAVREYQIQSKFGIVKDNKNKFIKVEEKPTFKYLINAGQYVLEKKVFKHVKKNESIDMPNFFMRLKKLRTKIFIYSFSNSWNDIASVKDLNHFKKNFEKFNE